MNIAAMAAVALVVLAEKALPLGRRVKYGLAAAMAVYGVVALAYPAALPTTS